MGAASSHPEDERKIANIVEKLRADGAEEDFRSAEDAERAVASAAAAETRRAARPARRTPARRAPATPPPTKRVKVKREGEPRRSVRRTIQRSFRPPGLQKKAKARAVARRPTRPPGPKSRVP